MSVKSLFTVRQGNPISVRILELLLEKQLRDPQKYPVKIRIFENETEAYGASELESVGVTDTEVYEVKRYRPTRAADVTSKPAWFGSAFWALLINPAPFTTDFRPRGDGAPKAEDVYKARIDNCADQIRAMFITNFDSRRAEGRMPWEGPARTQARPPACVPQAVATQPIDRATYGGRGLKSVRCYS